MTVLTLAALSPDVIAKSDSSWLASALVAAIVAAAVSLTTFGLAGRRARLDRQRQLFADAFEAVTEYREYPFIVLRRSHSEPAAERARIAGDLSKVQSRINAFRARLRVEAPFVAECYGVLVTETRRLAGAFITEAWNRPPIANDADVHNPGWDFTALTAHEDAYLDAVGDHLGWIHPPLRRWRRRRWSRRATS